MKKTVMYRDMDTGEVTSGPEIPIDFLGEYSGKMFSIAPHIVCFFE